MKSTFAAIALSCGVLSVAVVVSAAPPVLYVDSKDGSLVVRGVYTDGRRVTLPEKYFGPSSAGMPIWSPDGARFAGIARDTSTSKTVLELGNLSGDTKTIPSPDNAVILPPLAWSPDGRKIAVGLRTAAPPAFTIAVIDVAAQKILSRHEIRPNERAMPLGAIGPEVKSRFRWSPDSKKILLSVASVVVIDTINGGQETVADKPLLVEWAPGSDGVYYFDVPEIAGSERGSYLQRLRVLGDFFYRPLGSAKPEKLIDRKDMESLGLSDAALIYGIMALSPKGAKLAVWGTDPTKGPGGAIHIYDLLTGQTAVFTKPPKTFRTNDLIVAVEWSPDGDSLAIAGVGESELSVKLLTLATGDWRTLARVGEEASDDGQVINMLYGLGRKTLSWAE